MIEHCISTLKSNKEEKSYKAYVTDALMVIAENTTHFLGFKDIVDYGTTINKRWIDVIEPKTKKPEETDNRSVEEIVTDMWKKIRGH